MSRGIQFKRPTIRCGKKCQFCLLPKYKLHPEEARKIYALYHVGYNAKDVASLFRISPQHVANIGAARRWTEYLS